MLVHPRKRNSDEDEHLEDWRKHNRLQGWRKQTVFKRKDVQLVKLMMTKMMNMSKMIRLVVDSMVKRVAINIR